MNTLEIEAVVDGSCNGGNIATFVAKHLGGFVDGVSVVVWSMFAMETVMRMMVYYLGVLVDFQNCS